MEPIVQIKSNLS